MFDFVSIGDIKLDTFVVIDHASIQCQLKMPECQLCLEYGAKIAVEVVDSQIAGSAPNVSTGLAKMGHRTAVVSNMGKDGTRQLALEKLKERNVSTKYIRIVPSEQSAYSVVLNYKGDRTILASHIHHAYRLPPDLKTKWLYISEMGGGYEALYKQVIARAKRNGVHIAVNPGSIQITEKKPVLFALFKYTYILFVNVEEARAITGETREEIHHLATELWRLGPKHVVITDGKNGAYSFDGKELLHCPIFPGKLVESTGAGDSFATGFIGALMNKHDHHEALRWGSVNSASVVGFVGPTAGLLTETQIRARLRKHSSFRPVTL